jgi:trigger factor
MQVTETEADGLKRELTIVVPAGELEDKVTRRLEEIGRAVRVPGFRPGRVPLQILRRRFGPAVLGEVLQDTVQQTSSEAMQERNLRPALPPKLDLAEFKEGADLEYKMSLEVLPDIPELDASNLEVDRLVVEVPDADVDKAIERIAEQHRKSAPVERAAAQGDVIVADLDGRAGDEPIPGASGQDRNIELGAGYLIEGFEDQLIGAAAGEERTVNVTFPADYGAADLAGKAATFAVKVKEVRERQPAQIDDALAAEVGLENLAELRDEVRQRMQRDWNAVARQQLKRKLLDKLSERYEFAVPPSMVELEFAGIWRQHEQMRAAEAERAAGSGETPAGEIAEAVAAAEAAAGAPPEEAEAAAADKPEDEALLKQTYRNIAERRVRLGLLLAEIGRSNNISVTQDELNLALRAQAMRHPGHEREVVEYFRNNPSAAGELRAPILEDKVIDFIVELAKLPERKLTPQELLAEAGATEPEAAAAPTEA